MITPQITGTRDVYTTPWMRLVEKDVVLDQGQEPQTFHAISQPDYVTAVAITDDGMMPIVRQFRPASEGFTWEFPAGTLDQGETPKESAVRELLEETGYEATEVIDLGWYHPDTGRLSLKGYVFFIRCKKSEKPFTPEDGIELKLVSKEELKEMILNLSFNHQLHCGAYAAASLRELL